MSVQKPHLIVVSGPNGAGKSTTAPSLLKGTLRVTEFVNADLIAQGLSGFKPEGAVFHAGRVMLERIHYLAKKQTDFAFETTLASRTFAPWIADLCKTGYTFHLVFLWLPNEEFAVRRVAERVRMGGHNVPEETIRRRYHASIRNFFKLYSPLADTWFFYDNSGSEPRLLASGEKEQSLIVNDSDIWHNIKENYDRKEKA
ncbi:MAG: zeta toxin family protein [Thermodesulfovibrionales bacterium]|nr:zeta toxin family protein [Thermodesulfovibrionales bacterium]